MKHQETSKNLNLPIDSYVPLEYFENKDLFVMKYNVAQR